MSAHRNSLASPVAEKRARADKRNRGELSHIQIDPAENGYMVTSHFEPKSSKNNTIYPDPEKNVFGEHAAASAHIAKLLSDHASTEVKD
jgi:hypothetical protein